MVDHHNTSQIKATLQAEKRKTSSQSGRIMVQCQVIKLILSEDRNAYRLLQTTWNRGQPLQLKASTFLTCPIKENLSRSLTSIGLHLINCRSKLKMWQKVKLNKRRISMMQTLTLAMSGDSFRQTASYLSL